MKATLKIVLFIFIFVSCSSGEKRQAAQKKQQQTLQAQKKNDGWSEVRSAIVKLDS